MCAHLSGVLLVFMVIPGEFAMIESESFDGRKESEDYYGNQTTEENEERGDDETCGGDLTNIETPPVLKEIDIEAELADVKDKRDCSSCTIIPDFPAISQRIPSLGDNNGKNACWITTRSACLGWSGDLKNEAKVRGNIKTVYKGKVGNFNCDKSTIYRRVKDEVEKGLLEFNEIKEHIDNDNVIVLGLSYQTWTEKQKRPEFVDHYVTIIGYELGGMTEDILIVHDPWCGNMKGDIKGSYSEKNILGPCMFKATLSQGGKTTGIGGLNFAVGVHQFRKYYVIKRK